jgi:hypothetical protein
LGSDDDVVDRGKKTCQIDSIDARVVLNVVHDISIAVKRRNEVGDMRFWAEPDAQDGHDVGMIEFREKNGFLEESLLGGNESCNMMTLDETLQVATLQTRVRLERFLTRPRVKPVWERQHGILEGRRAYLDKTALGDDFTCKEVELSITAKQVGVHPLNMVDPRRHVGIVGRVHGGEEGRGDGRPDKTNPF